MPEVSDEELQALQTAKAEREALQAERDKLKAEHEASTQKLTQAEQQRQQLEQQAAFLAQQVQRQQAPPPPAPPAEEPTDFLALDPRKYKQEIIEQVAQGVNGVVQDYWKNSRINARRAAKQVPELKKFLDHPEYGKEIEQMLDTVPPNMVLTVDAYEQAVSAVKAKHFDQLLEEEVTKRTAPPPPDEGEEEYEDEEEELPQAARGTARPTARRAPAPAMPTSSRAVAGGAAVSTSPKRKFKPLTQEEKYAAARFRMTEEEYDRYSHGELTADVFGFKGRDRV